MLKDDLGAEKEYQMKVSFGEKKSFMTELNQNDQEDEVNNEEVV